LDGIKNIAVSLVMLTCMACYANASPCDRMKVALAPKQNAELSAAIAGQMGSPSAKILHTYRLGNWYMYNVTTPLADGNLVFFRGDPATHRYVTVWSGAGTRTPQSELRSWARSNAPGIPEALAKCFAFTATGQR
jgi:hypothetical protein